MNQYGVSACHSKQLKQRMNWGRAMIGTWTLLSCVVICNWLGVFGNCVFVSLSTGYVRGCVLHGVTGCEMGMFVAVCGYVVVFDCLVMPLCEWARLC